MEETKSIFPNLYLLSFLFPFRDLSTSSFSSFSLHQDSSLFKLETTAFSTTELQLYNSRKQYRKRAAI
jgi:hypothetical protein